ncbi:hypothetical protein HPB47_003776 [Ixodes persulcatus]|uniref:Uncharacterized protein n=1 Tax=Ixodes persulcatus TaxID=34615 RepID=A0AC60PHP0_IXOPE|nr:hypothetical protein HPB47_003776 [Ixodes persulcatus]
MEVTVEGTEITPETLREPGWLPAHRKHRHKSPDAETTPATRQQSTPSSKFRPRKLPPLPQLPAEDYKVVIRLQGGFNAKSWSAAQISDSIQHCAQLRSGAEENIIRAMPEQNIVIASTPEEDNAVAYCSLKEAQKIGARTYSSTTYVTSPDNSAKGVIHNIPSYDRPADIERKTASVLIVFEGKSVPYYVNYRNTTYRCLLCRRKIEVCENCYKVGHRKDICPTPDDKRCSKCGTLAPEGSHECTLRCTICGNKLQTKKLHHPLQDLASEGKAAPRTGALPLNQHTQLIEVKVTPPAARKTRDPPEAQQPLSDHYILSTTIPTSGYKHKKRGVRITEGDRLRKIRQEIAPTTIDNIEEWTQQLQDDVETYTQDIPEEAGITEIDNRLLHMWQARQSLHNRWLRQKHNRTLQLRIARLDQDIAEYATNLTHQQWHQICDNMQGSLGMAKTWHLLKHLLHQGNTRAEHRRNMSRLIHHHRGDMDAFLQKLQTRYIGNQIPTTTALGLPIGTSTDKLRALGVHNTVEELIEGHLHSQYTRLTTTATGRHILAALVIQHEGTTQPNINLPREVRKHLLVSPLPKNMHPEYHDARRRDRCKHLHERYHQDLGAVYTDAADHATNPAMTMVVTNSQGVLLSGGSIATTSTEDAEETAIALAVTLPNATTIISDSKRAVQNYARGRISRFAARILRDFVPTDTVSIVWAPAHSSLPGNDFAHNTARELAYRAAGDRETNLSHMRWGCPNLPKRYGNVETMEQWDALMCSSDPVVQAAACEWAAEAAGAQGLPIA